MGMNNDKPSVKGMKKLANVVLLDKYTNKCKGLDFPEDTVHYEMEILKRMDKEFPHKKKGDNNK